MKIPKAREAINKEWKKLEDRTAWDLSQVWERTKVQQWAKRKNYTVHFGTLTTLCHIKHSELAEIYRVYKGRVVFRGDNIKDEDGYLAVFSEQGTSASHSSAAKFLDAIAHFPGMDG